MAGNDKLGQPEEWPSLGSVKLSAHLRESLVGNTKTTFICTLDQKDILSTTNTLNFATEIQKQETYAKINLKPSHSSLLQINQIQKQEIRDLKGKLREKEK
jgi:hypothetical protein